MCSKIKAFFLLSHLRGPDTAMVAYLSIQMTLNHKVPSKLSGWPSMISISVDRSRLRWWAPLEKVLSLKDWQTEAARTTETLRSRDRPCTAGSHLECPISSILTRLNFSPPSRLHHLVWGRIIWSTSVTLKEMVRAKIENKRNSLIRSKPM